MNHLFADTEVKALERYQKVMENPDAQAAYRTLDSYAFQRMEAEERTEFLTWAMDAALEHCGGIVFHRGASLRAAMIAEATSHHITEQLHTFLAFFDMED